MKVKLLIDVDAEGVHISAGTICEVEKFYPPNEREFSCYDLKAGEVLFWVNADKVEEVKND